MTLLLNLGAGERLVTPENGLEVINHDRTRHSPSIDIAWDLDQMPWPWPDATFDRVCAWAVLEHLTHTLVESFNECHRVLKIGGELEIKLPYWDSDEAHVDPTHRWYVSLKTFDHFDPSTDRGRRFAFYGVSPWRIESAGFTAEGASVYARLVKLDTLEGLVVAR